MTILDDKLVPGVLKIANRLGHLVTVVKESASTYDPNTGIGIPSSVQFTGINLTPGAASQAWIESGLAQESDTGGVMAASGLGFVPELGDRVVFETSLENWRVMHVDELESGDDVAGYKLSLQEVPRPMPTVIDNATIGIAESFVQRRAITKLVNEVEAVVEGALIAISTLTEVAVSNDVEAIVEGVVRSTVTTHVKNVNETEGITEAVNQRRAIVQIIGRVDTPESVEIIETLVRQPPPFIRQANETVEIVEGIVEGVVTVVEIQLTSLPVLSGPKRAGRGTAGEPAGWAGSLQEAKHYGDGQVMLAAGKWRHLYRCWNKVHPGETGAAYSEVDELADGAPYEGWSFPEHLHPELGHGTAIEDPARPIVVADPGTNGGNIDTAGLVHWFDKDAGVDRFMGTNGVKPGALEDYRDPELEFGRVFTIQRRTTEGVDLPHGEASWTSYGDEHLITPTQEPGEFWAQPYLGPAIGQSGIAPNEWFGGCAESSFVIETSVPPGGFESGSEIGDIICFFEAKGVSAFPASEGFRTHRLGRAVAKLEDLHAGKGLLNFTWTLDPTNGFVFSAPLHGGVEGAFGTSGQTLRMNVTKGPGGVYHGVYINLEPGGNWKDVAITSGLAHVYSLDRGKTWNVDQRLSAIIDRDVMAAADPSWDERSWFLSEMNPVPYHHRSVAQGRVGGPPITEEYPTGQYRITQNVWNSPFMAWDFASEIGWFGFYASQYEMFKNGSPGSHQQLWLCQFDFDAALP